MLDAIARLLHELAGARVRGAVDLGNPAAPVLRVSLDGRYDGIGTTVIAKVRRPPGAGWNTDPAYLRNERHALERLGRADVPHTPRFLTGDDELGIVVMSDLGAGPSVQDLLAAASPTAAAHGVAAMARTAGRVHAARGLDRFRAARPVAFLDDPTAVWHGLRDAAEHLGFPSPARATGDVEALAGALAGERFRGFTHGDLTPNNALMLGGEAGLIDFEGAGVRHLGIDAACLRLPFPQYGRWAVLPGQVLADADRAYRAELATGFPTVADDAVYERLMAEGCLAWALCRASRLPLIASTDQSADEAVRRRTQIVHTLGAATGTARPTGLFPALCGWFDELAEAMRTRWAEARLPPREFAAFSTPSNGDGASPESLR